jgi:hypothetical protein
MTTGGRFRRDLHIEIPPDRYARFMRRMPIEVSVDAKSHLHVGDRCSAAMTGGKTATSTAEVEKVGKTDDGMTTVSILRIE